VQIKRKKLFIISTATLLIIQSFNCSKKSDTQATVACDPMISFSKTIKPIMDRDCNSAGCHDDQVITALNTYQIVHDGAAQIRLSISTGKMPKNRTISDTDKNAIFCWIDNGAKNN